MAAQRPKKVSGNTQVRDCRLEITAQWEPVLGTTVTWRFWPEGVAPVLGEDPLYQVNREGFECRSLESLVEAIRGTWVAIQMAAENARRTN